MKVTKEWIDKAKEVTKMLSDAQHAIDELRQITGNVCSVSHNEAMEFKKLHVVDALQALCTLRSLAEIIEPNARHAFQVGNSFVIGHLKYHVESICEHDGHTHYVCDCCDHDTQSTNHIPTDLVDAIAARS